MYTLFLCWRYLRKRRITLFPVAAVMLCVALLIVVTSLFEGFVDKFHEYSARAFGQIVVRPRVLLDDYRGLAAHLAQTPGVANVSCVLKSGGLLYLGPGDVRAVQIEGVDLAERAKEGAFVDGLLIQNDPTQTPSFDLSDGAAQAARDWLAARLEKRVQRGMLSRAEKERRLTETPPPVGMILGIGVLGKPDEKTDAYDYGAIIERITMLQTPLSITTGRMTSDADGQQSPEKAVARCWPVDVIETGLHLADTSYVYLPFDYLRELVGRRTEDGGMAVAAELHVTAAAGIEATNVVEPLKRAWSDYARRELRYDDPQGRGVLVMIRGESAYAQLYTNEIRKQLWMMQIILTLVSLVVVVLVFVVLSMIVTQRRRDVGVVRSIGASRLGVARVFLAYGVVIGGVGALLGLGLGVLATRHINLLETVLSRLLGFKVWKSGQYLFRDIPNEVAWESVAGIMAAGVLAALIGAVLPAWRAARMHPAEALRYE